MDGLRGLSVRSVHGSARRREEELMILAIDMENVAEVLLVDGWHRVSEASFTLDSYALRRGGNGEEVPITGASWKERDGSVIYCPMSAVLAVKTKAERQPTRPNIRHLSPSSSGPQDLKVE
jgi:hypothetical protein